MAHASSSLPAGVEPVLPSNAFPSPFGIITAVSCTSPGNCTAVGTYSPEYRNSVASPEGLIVTESGGSWAPGIEAPLPAGAAPDPFAYVTITSISCPSVGNCSAVGIYEDDNGFSQGLLLSEIAGSWSATEAPLPGNANQNIQDASVLSVSCPATGNCTAVGQYYDTASHYDDLVWTETGGTWAASPVGAQLPAGAGNQNFSSPISVSCGSPGNCVAVGSYVDTSNATHGLLVTESGGTGATGTEAQLPANGSGNQSASLSSVACPSAGNCTAVGYYVDDNGLDQGLVMTESAGSWGTGVEAQVSGSSQAVLNSVACPSAGTCTAVGDFIGAARNEGMLVNESGGSVSPAVAAVLPAGASASQRTSIISVSCASAGDCTAAGSYGVGTTGVQGLLINESSGSWGNGLQATVSSSDTVPDVTIPTVSCASQSSCIAGGRFQDSATNDQAGLWSAGVTTPSLAVTAPAAGQVATTLPASTVSATLSSGASPVGMITFDVFGPQAAPPSSCDSAGTTIGTAGVTGNAGFTPSAAFTPVRAGDYWWYATYGGDATDLPAATTCGAGMAETVVAPATTALTVGAPSTAAVGTEIAATSITATLSGGVTPTGTVSYTVFGPQPDPPGACSSGGTQVGTSAVTSNTSYGSSAGFTPTAAGDYWWYAGYGGDANNASAASTCGSAMAETIVAPAAATVPAGPTGVTGTTGAVTPVLTSPVLTSLKISPHKVSTDGRMVGGRCVKPSRGSARRPSCRRAISLSIGYALTVATTVAITFSRDKGGRWISVPGEISVAAASGADSFTFDGRLDGHRLGPGRYRLIAQPAGGRPQSDAFRITG